MGKNVKHRLFRPARLIIIEKIFREAAGVHDAEMRADARPAVGRGLTSIIEAGPDESAGDERASRVILEPIFRQRAPVGPVYVVGRDVAARLVVFVDAAR